MKIIRSLLSWMIFVSVLSLFSCSKEEYFQSESGVKKKLEGSWNLIPIPRYNPAQLWVFDDTKFIRHQDGMQYTGDFKINTTLFKAEIKVENMPQPSGSADYNGTWQIVRLDKDFLVIANDHDGTTGIMELEFQKQN